MYELLIVDDEETPRNNLATYFPWQEQGFHVCGQAENGAEALAFIETHTVHVVLTDISMPVMNGIELARNLREKNGAPCVVFLSAYDDFHYAQNAIRYGVRFYILKPSDFAEIKDTFAQIRAELNQKFQVADTLSSVKGDDETVNQVLDYIKQEYADASLAELAKRLYVNASYLSQLIKLKTGKNFVELLQDERMRRACILLQDPLVKIYHISSLVGYSNPNNFTRAFKACYQVSPKEYRIRCLAHRGGTV